MRELDAIISRLEPELGPLEGEPEPLEGGMTNRNYRVRLGGEDLVLRLCNHGAEVLGIDRTTEEIASRRAAAERIAPPVVAFLSDVPAIVTRWLPGGNLTPEEVRWLAAHATTLQFHLGRYCREVRRLAAGGGDP